jgi:lysophospholipase L1-like esterase
MGPFRRAARRLALTFAVAGTGLAMTGCTAPAPVASPDAAADRPVVAFYGDSYTLGTGAGDLRNRWSTVICETRGWTEYNPSVNGLGFVNNRNAVHDLPTLIVERDPDIVFVTMGLNDNFAYERAGSAIRDQIVADLDLLASELPDARLVVVEPFWYTDQRPESVEIIIGWVREAAEDAGADWIPGASRWLEGHPEWMAADGLHPNDAGYAEMAERMDAELTAIGL